MTSVGRWSAPAAQPEVQAHGGGPVPVPAPGEERGQAQRFLRRRELRASLLIGLCCLLVYNANRRAISAGDCYPARYLPFAIWQYHSILLDPIAPVTAQGRGDTAFWMVPVPDGHIISLYPVVLPVLIAPLYLPAVGYLRLQGWTDARLDHIARVMEKLSASLVAALSASVLYLLLRRRVAAPIALLLTLAYAFGTTTWVISSQALWQHGMAGLLVTGALLLLTGPCTAPRALAAGLLCGLIAGNRPPDVILAAVLGAYGLFWAGRRAALLAAAAALPIGLVLLYNLGVADHFAGGYGRVGDASFFQHDLLSGLGGLLFSPTRGLFVFSPFLLFLVLVWRHLPSDRGERGLTLAISVGVVLQVLLYAMTDWRAGISWGPRFLTGLLPLLMWMLAPVVASLRRFGRTCFLLAVGAAVAIEAIGAFWYTGATDSAIFAGDSGPHPMQAAWDWRNAPFVAPLQHGRAPAELMIEMRGNLDIIEADGRATSAVTAGQEVVAAGWALAGHATPWQVAIAIDGRQIATSRTFRDRSDVRGTLHEASPSGWRIPLDTAGLAPGEHHLAAFAWASEKGERYYLAERKMTVRMRGNFDAIEAGGRATSAVTAGQEVAAAGWALAGHATPWQVAVVIDGQQTVASRTFFDRPDVRDTLHEASPAGWRIPFGTAGLAPGEHHLTAFAWASEKGERYYLGERKLTVRRAELAADEELDDGVRTATARLREHQQGPGYWLTSYTTATHFQEPRQEMNTFLTALLLDLLDPLAATGHLGDSLQRARQHLTGQIEAGGLVRYHGLPDGPGIGTLGCAITPDTDDTALVWRLAPGHDRRRLLAALATINQYRTREGLYHTWLAPREAYQCLDPGSDPNPADIAIQMHLLLLLAEVQPPAGRALCEALRPVVDQDRVWVYYRMAPLVPMLRLTDLQRAGCALELPGSRMRTPVPGQEIWVSVVRLLGRTRAPGGVSADAADAAQIETVLRQLAKDDFALLRKSPPLLYHNDLTATVPRYYWSEDVGYALWLRLYYEHAHPEYSHPSAHLGG
jgi:hypothetical protein